MNWLVAFGSLCSFGTLVTVARFVFVAGTFKQRFVDTEKRGAEHEKRLHLQHEHLGRHDVAIGKLEALHAAGK